MWDKPRCKRTRLSPRANFTKSWCRDREQADDIKSHSTYVSFRVRHIERVGHLETIHLLRLERGCSADGAMSLSAEPRTERRVRNEKKESQRTGNLMA